MNNHPFHLVDKSPWPIFMSMSLMSLTSGGILWMSKLNQNLMFLGMIVTLMIMVQWWRDVVRESTFQGIHTNVVIYGLKWGMILFILSEIMFFISFFWSFFHSSLSPSVEMGMQWPPLGIISFDPMGVPMLNTMILLSSGVSMTWAHNALLNNNLTQCKNSMLITITLGIYFSFLQLYEYIESPFCMADSVYGSTFFMSTGFHGIHVIVGSIFIITMIFRVSNLHFSSKHHIGFEFSAWYWHFVDVVWLFLYLMIYWWGN
uniref:cytochrome c oxidase subunit III n=1 Tax=Amritodus flavoscutatus TaxID=2479863 RepID=UPI002E770055|nr:cytochrome c oxidase subunit III [Amritodus flavoscutatus]WQF70192.1 cytochrome c oxidase subunit III [Amritodus flavoscutatus]